MIATIARAARAVVPDRASRDQAKLEKAISDLRRLEAVRAAIRKFTDDAIALLTAHLWRTEEAEQALTASLQTGDIEKVSEALRLNDGGGGAEIVRRQLAVLHHRVRYSGDFEAFKAEHPEAKSILTAAGEARLKEAKGKAATALAQEQERLGSEYDGADSPVVRRANTVVSHLESMQRRIESEPIDVTWTAFASQLLSE